MNPTKPLMPWPFWGTFPMAQVGFQYPWDTWGNWKDNTVSCTLLAYIISFQSLPNFSLHVPILTSIYSFSLFSFQLRRSDILQNTLILAQRVAIGSRFFQYHEPFTAAKAAKASSILTSPSRTRHQGWGRRRHSCLCWTRGGRSWYGGTCSLPPHSERYSWSWRYGKVPAARILAGSQSRIFDLKRNIYFECLEIWKPAVSLGVNKNSIQMVARQVYRDLRRQGSKSE